MRQEVQIILTLEADASLSKRDIQNFFYDMESCYQPTSKNRWEIPKITLVKVEEESEIYGTKEK